MKHSARILRRERSRIAYENAIVLEAELLLSPTPSATFRGIGGTTPAWAKSDGEIFIDSETSPTHNVIIDDPLIHVWDARVKRLCLAAVAPIPEQEPQAVPVVRVRSGGYGKAALLIPGLQDQISKVGTQTDTRVDLLSQDFIEEGIRWAEFDDIIRASDARLNKSFVLSAGMF